MAELTALQKLLQGASGTMPLVNPPEAARVLATDTAAEVSGQQVVSPVAAPLPPPVAAPEFEAPVVHAMGGTPTKRTAKVIQAELDAALAELESTKQQLASAESALERAVAERDATMAAVPAAPVASGPATVEGACAVLADAGFTVTLTYGGAR